MVAVSTRGLIRSEGDVETKLLHPLFRQQLGYPDEELAWKESVVIPQGTGRKVLQADLIVRHRGSPTIVVEAKKPTEPVTRNLDQIDSYAFWLRTPYSVITNGRHFLLRGYYSFNSRINVIDDSVDALRRDSWGKLRNLISFENISSSIEPANVIAEPDKDKIEDYRKFFRRIHNVIRDRDKLAPDAAFDELSKLLFLKAAEDEWRVSNKSRPVLTPEKIEEWEHLGDAKALINQWFKSATSELFPGVFGDHPQIDLSPATLREVLKLMAPFHVKDGDVDVKGRAFEEFLPSQLRGKGLGQYFTPRPIVDFMAGLAQVSIMDVVVDFACGSGGFLIKAFEQMQRGLEELPAGTIQRLGATRQGLLEEVKSQQIFGIDAEPRAARTAKMNMLMWGDGRRVVRGNALNATDFRGQAYEPAEYDPRNQGSGCTLILANPPFGSKEEDESILARYDLGSRLYNRKSEKTEVLFIEKGLKLLQPEGRMLIVLPQGLISSTNNVRVRDYIHSQAEIRAIISLPSHTFSPSGVPMVNACILYVQKFTHEKKALYNKKSAGRSPEQVRQMLRSDPDFDYTIFMGIAENVGYEPNGRPSIRPGRKTDLQLLLDEFLDQSGSPPSNVDIFEFANERYGGQAASADDPAADAGSRSLKSSFVVPLSETAERLDPPYYLLHRQAKELLASLTPLGSKVKEKKAKFRPGTDAEMDADYNVLSVSNDGLVKLNMRVKGEYFTSMKRVHENDIVYNPMRINVGSIGVVPKQLNGGLVSPDYVVFQSKQISPDFLVTLLRSPFYRMYIDVTSTGSIRNRLYFDNLRDIRVPTVSGAVQAAICDAVGRAHDTHEARRQAAEERAEIVGRLNDLIRSSAEPLEGGGEADALFRELADQWRRERPRSSSAARMADHPAYLRIIEMGQNAIPLLLRELRERPDHWFAALHAVTGENPVPEESRGRLPQMAAAWIAWGEKNGYI